MIRPRKFIINYSAQIFAFLNTTYITVTNDNWSAMITLSKVKYKFFCFLSVEQKIKGTVGVRKTHFFIIKSWLFSVNYIYCNICRPAKRVEMKKTQFLNRRFDAYNTRRRWSVHFPNSFR